MGLWATAFVAFFTLPLAAAPPPAPAGIASSLVDFKTGTFEKVLPFDVKVQLYGDVDATVSGIEVRYLETTDEVDVDSECRVSGGDIGTWTTATGGLFEGDSANGGPKIFRINLGPLKAQRFYTFCFEREEALNSATNSALEAKAKLVLDDQLAGLVSGDMTKQQLDTLRTRLREEVKRTLPDQQIRFASSSFLAEDLSDEKLEDRRKSFVDAWAAALEAQLRAKSALNGVAARQDDLRQRLSQLVTDPALGRGVELLRNQAQSDAGLAAFVTAHQEGLDLLALQGDGLRRLSQGLAPQGSGGVGLAEGATADELAGAAERYSDLAANVTAGGSNGGGVGDLVAKMVGANGSLALRLQGLTAADRQALTDLLRPAGLLAAISTDARVLANRAQRVDRQTAARQTALDSMAQRAMTFVRASISVVSATTAGSFDTFQRFFASADIGLLYAPDIDEIVPHVGANIYLRPVNPDASLRELRETLGGFSKTFSRRFSLTAALTASSIKDTDSLGRERDDLFGSQSLLLGAGYRLTDVMRLGIGGLIFKQDDPDPLVDDPTVTVTPYLTLSFDAGFAKSLNGLGAIFGGGGS